MSRISIKQALVLGAVLGSFLAMSPAWADASYSTSDNVHGSITGIVCSSALIRKGRSGSLTQKQNTVVDFDNCTSSINPRFNGYIYTCTGGSIHWNDAQRHKESTYSLPNSTFHIVYLNRETPTIVGSDYGSFDGLISELPKLQELSHCNLLPAFGTKKGDKSNWIIF